MVFKDLKVGDNIYILESSGTFRKVNSYNLGTIVAIGQEYDDITNNPYLIQSLKKKLIDITISCDGIQKKLTVGADKSTITDNVIGLTVSTDKQELITQVNNQCKEYEAKIKAIEFYKEEINKCHNILDMLQDNDTPPTQTEEDTIRVN